MQCVQHFFNNNLENKNYVITGSGSDMPLVRRTYSRSMDRTLESSRLSVLVRDFVIWIYLPFYSVLWNWKYKSSCGNYAVLRNKHIRVRIDYERSVWLSPELVLRVKRARRKWPRHARNCCPRFLRLAAKERLPAVYIRMQHCRFTCFFT